MAPDSSIDKMSAERASRLMALLQRPFPINSIALTTLCLFA